MQYTFFFMKRDTTYYRVQILHMADNLPAGYICRRRNPYRTAADSTPTAPPQPKTLEDIHPRIYRLKAFL